MRLVRRQREKSPLRSNEAVGTPEEKMTGSPSELLTPEVRTKLLEIKRGYEGGMIGDRIPPYTNFLAAARRCWPELADELQITDRFTLDVSSRIPWMISNLTAGNGEGRQQEYWEGLHFLSKLAFIKPELIQDEVQKNQDRLLELLDEELRGTKCAYILALTSLLWLGAPETQLQVAEKIHSKSDEIRSFATKHKVWWIGGLGRLFLPELDINIPETDQESLIKKNQQELLRLVHVPNGGMTTELDARLDIIFAVGALLADEVKLRPNGTVQYTYSKVPKQTPGLPERPLT